MTEETNTDEQEQSEEKEGEQSNLSPLEEARALDSSLAQRNTDFKELLDRQEKLLADNMLGGKGVAGQPPKKPEEETPEAYVGRIMSGDV